MTIEKNDKPGPSTYDAESSFNFANTFRGRNAFDKTKRVSFCETQAKLNISPGPAKHTHSIKMLDKLSLSPLASSRKRLWTVNNFELELSDTRMVITYLS